MKHFTLPLLIIIISLSACHSNNNNVTPSRDIWGDLSVIVRSSDSNFVFPGIYDETATSQFYSSANSYWTKVPVTRISANGNNLSDNGDTQYVGEPGAGISTHVLWEVTGGSGVPSFSFDDVNTFPAYSGPSLPDTITRTNGFTMSFPANTLNGDDSVSIIFNEYAQYYSKSMDQNRMITFTAQELNTLPPGINYVNLTIDKPVYQTFSGKQYVFNKERVYMRTVFVR